MPWNLSTDRPIYIQLVEHIQFLIISGHYKPGDKLPSVRDFAAEAAVNPNTMQKALSELERANLIYTNRTSGKFITEDDSMISAMKQSLAKEEVRKFLDGMKKLGFTKQETLDILSHISDDDNQHQ